MNSQPAALQSYGFVEKTLVKSLVLLVLDSVQDEFVQTKKKVKKKSSNVLKQKSNLFLHSALLSIGNVIIQII